MLLIIITFFAAILIIQPANALPEDRSLPYELTSDSAQFDQEKGIGIYKGSVFLKQGTLELRATEARIYMINQELNHVEADGPITIKYLPELNKPWVNAKGATLHYDAKQGIITLSGKADVTQGEDQITGDVMTYDVNKNIIKANAGHNERVRMEIKPNSIKKKK